MSARDRPRVLERAVTAHGEFVLRQRGEDLELIADGVFLMSTADARSERLLATVPLAAHPRPRHVFVAGLGLGVTAAAALADPRVQAVTVVELEPRVVAWQREHPAPAAGRVVDDPRVTVIVADLRTVLDGTPAPSPADVACLDVDNGPGWTLTARNRELYEHPALRRLAGLLAPDGLAAFWSAAADAGFAARLQTVFGAVAEHEVPVPRGEPDRVIVAGRRVPDPGGGGAPPA